jgi:hypothetical protein
MQTVAVSETVAAIGGPLHAQTQSQEATAADSGLHHNSFVEPHPEDPAASAHHSQQQEQQHEQPTNGDASSSAAPEAPHSAAAGATPAGLSEEAATALLDPVVKEVRWWV